MQLAGTAVYTLLFLFYLRRAYQDHAALPWARYRLSNLYIRLLVSLHCKLHLLTTWGLATLATALGAPPPAKPLSPAAGKLLVLQDSWPAGQCFSTPLLRLHHLPCLWCSLPASSCWPLHSPSPP